MNEKLEMQYIIPSSFSAACVYWQGTKIYPPCLSCSMIVKIIKMHYRSIRPASKTICQDYRTSKIVMA